jgi:transaldolase
LWASTGVKDPAYPDTMYVEELVTRGVVNTMPEATILAVADHGTPPADSASWDTVRGTYTEARATLARLAEAGIDLDEVTDLLETEGVQKFEDAWTELLAHVEVALKK